MADPAICTGFTSNSAIFGIGTRVAFYVNSILAAVTPIKSTYSSRSMREIELGNQEVQPKREISSVITVQGANALALLVTAAIQTAVGHLSLYHAFLIIILLCLLSTSFIFVIFNPIPVLPRRSFFLFSLVLLATFSLYVGLHARTFGSQPECNDTVKVIWKFKVTTASFTWFRNIGIVIFAIYITLAAFHVLQLCCFRANLASIYLRVYGFAVLGVNILIMAILEQTIIVNKVPEDTTWTFGQTLPIVMLIGPLVDVWVDNYPLAKAWWIKRRAARDSTLDTPLVPYPPNSPHTHRPTRSGYVAVDG